MSLNFLNKGVGTLVTNNEGKNTVFIVEKPDGSSSNLNACLIDLDLGAVDNLNDVFKSKKNLTVNATGDQATIVKWYNNSKKPLAAIGLSSGSISIINPYTSIASNTINTGSKSSISGLEFSHQDPTLANISQGGFLTLVDITSLNITKLCTDITTSNYNSTVAWNHRVGHILATNNPNGNANIWDIKLKKTATSFGNNLNFTSVQWIPEQATQLITSLSERPMMQLWDLRNTALPVREFDTPCLVKNLTFSPHNNSIFTSTGLSDDKLLLWNIDFELQNSILFDLESTLSFSQSYITWSMYNPSLVLWNSSESISLTNIYNGAKVANIPHLNTLKYGITTGFASRICTFGDSKVMAYKAVCEQVKMDMSIIENDMSACKIICESRAKSKSTDDLDKTSWMVTSALFSSNRNDVLSAIGLNVENVILNAKELLGETIESNEIKQETDDPEEFFRELGQRSDLSARKEDKKPQFVYEGNRLPQEIAKSLDDCISIGDLGIAADLCLMSGRVAEALLLAHSAGADVWNRISKSIISNSKDPLINKIAMLTSGDLETLVLNANLKEWKLILACICTFSDGNKFVTHCCTLAERLINNGMKGAAIVCYQVAGNVNEAFENWYYFPEPIDTKILRMAMFQKACRCSPSGSSLDKFVDLVSNMSEKLAQSGYITEAMGLLSIIQPQQMVEMQVYRISQLHGNAMNPPYSLIPIYFTQQNARTTPTYQQYNKPTFTQPMGGGGGGGGGVGVMGSGVVQGSMGPPTMIPLPLKSGSLGGAGGGGVGGGVVSTPRPAPVVSTPRPAPMVSTPRPVPHSVPSSAIYTTPARTPVRTTAPTAVADAMYPGMPLPWPIPTPTQQMGSESNSTMDANMKIAAKSAPVPTGDPMSASNFSIVSNTIKGLVVNALVNESSTKKAQEIQLRIDQLFDSINSCKLSNETNNLLVDMCKSIEAGDFLAANRLLTSISSSAWDANNKGWIMVLKRLLPR